MEIDHHTHSHSIIDIDLIHKTIDLGDIKAFHKLAKRYKSSLLFMLERMTGNKDEAQTLLIEVFGIAYKKLNTYSGKSSFATWLFKIASKHCIEFLRVKKQSTKPASLSTLKLSKACQPIIEIEKLEASDELVADQIRHLQTTKTVC